MWPNDVEEVLFEHPKIHEVAVIGIPDEKRGETVKDFVVVEPSQTLTSKKMRNFGREKMAVYKMPTDFEIVVTLPKTMVGKVLRRELRGQTEWSKNRSC